MWVSLLFMIVTGILLGFHIPEVWLVAYLIVGFLVCAYFSQVDYENWLHRSKQSESKT